MTDLDRLKLWENYQSGQMDQQKASAFAKQIQSDPEWQDWIKQYRLVVDGIDLKIENDLRDQMDDWKKPHESKSLVSSNQRIFSARWILVAAATFLFVLMVPYWYGKTQYSDAALTSKYYQPPLSSTTRLGDQVSDAAFRSGKRAFAANNWTAAITHLRQIPDSSIYFAEAQLLLGHAAFNAGQFSEAKTIFQNLHHLGSIYGDTADWMTVLSLLRGDDSHAELSVALQGILQNKDHGYYNAAVHLQKDLQSFWRKIN